MSDDYGLTIYNNNGGLMFDSRRKMDSYVVTEVGTGTKPVDNSIGFDDFVFVKVPPSMSQYVVFMSMPTVSQTGFNAGSFYGYEPEVDDGNADLLTLDYFVAKHSSKVSRNGDYGLVIRNDDTTIQFDSRSVKTGNHFKITSAIEPKSYTCWTPTVPVGAPGADSLGDITDYWELRTWTWGMGVFYGSMVQERDVTGLRFITGPHGTGPIAYSWFSLNPGDAEDGHMGQSATHTYKSKIDSLILSAELV